MSTTCTTPPDPANLPMTSTTNPIAIPLQTLSQSSTTSSATVSEQTKRDNSYRYEGYQAFSSWMASEDDFFLFRRFDSLNAQTILWMQDRITRIEGDLQGIHKCIENSSFADGLRNDSFRWDERYAQKRHQLMGELSQILFHCSESQSATSSYRLPSLHCTPLTLNRPVHRLLFQNSRPSPRRTTQDQQRYPMAQTGLHL
jgi:hypothetical protein